jgi:hypothetical protein
MFETKVHFAKIGTKDQRRLLLRLHLPRQLRCHAVYRRHGEARPSAQCDVAKTSALEIGQAPTVAGGMGIGL